MTAVPIRIVDSHAKVSVADLLATDRARRQLAAVRVLRLAAALVQDHRTGQAHLVPVVAIDIDQSTQGAASP